MSNFNKVCPNGNTMIDCAPKDYANECDMCEGTGRYYYKSLTELFDALDGYRYDRNKRGRAPLSFRAWLKIAREWWKEGVVCPECGW